MIKVKVKDKGRPSKKEKLHKELADIKATIKTLEAQATPDNMLQRMYGLGIPLTTPDIMAFITLQVRKANKHRVVELPKFLVSENVNVLQLIYLDGSTITLYLATLHVRHYNTKVVVWGSLLDSTLLPRILRDIPL